MRDGWRSSSAIGSGRIQAGRDASSIRLVLASKTQPREAIRAAYRCGRARFRRELRAGGDGEARGAGGLERNRWHLIGHLQTNKAKPAASAFTLIHSVDSVRLAEAIARTQPSPRVHALIEVNLGGEASKTGVAPDRVAAIMDAAAEKIEIDGLMTIPPPLTAEAART